MMRVIALALFTSAIILAQVQHPNFSGVWKLAPEESDFAGLTAPRGRTATVKQQDASITEEVKDQHADSSDTVTLHFSVGGDASVNKILGKPMKSTARWDGQDLVISNVPQTAGDGAAFDDRWTLSLDANTLTVRTHFEDQGIAHDQMLVFHKEASGS